MNKKEAAEYLNLSTRAIERAVARGRLSVRYSKEKHGNTAVFNADEVRRYKAEIEIPPQYRPSQVPHGPQVPFSPLTDSPLRYGTAVTLGDFGSVPDLAGSVPIAQRLTLSVPEAASLSGLSVAFLLKAIKAHLLNAFEHEEDELRIKRADLDLFIQSL